jgi:hypothetical protein
MRWRERHLSGLSSLRAWQSVVSETPRTSHPAPGCNKPGTFRPEEAVEVVRDHEGGTRRIGVAADARSHAASCRAVGVDGPRAGRKRGTQEDEAQERRMRRELHPDPERALRR